ncbi:hypothetical protein [Vibrio rarus]|uniref:hypothetical protein n=1 Tax=Vibrio rarus TaxID=413403 RepID=UPI0021C3F90E|nr:hypothetical protein [Vibrio rarus]
MTQIKSNDVTIKNIFLFRTNQLQRLPYLGYSLVSFLFAILGCVILIEAIELGSNCAIILLMFPLLLAVVWFGGGLSIARWKNCGHKAWLYGLAAVVTMLLDLYFKGVASSLLWLYLLLRPQSKKI